MTCIASPSGIQNAPRIEKVGASPLVVLMHGIQGSKELFSQIIEEPLLSRLSLLAADFPGFGNTPAFTDRSASIDSYAAFIEALALSRGHREVVLIGHSLGGMVATKLLTSKKLRIRGLVSLEGNLDFQDCGSSRKSAALSELDFVNYYLPEMIERLASTDEKSASFRRRALQCANPRALYQASCSIVAESKNGELLRAFNESKIPRMLMVGERSSFATRKIEGDARVSIVPGAGHFLLQDNYYFVWSQISEFFKELSLI